MDRSYKWDSSGTILWYGHEKNLPLYFAAIIMTEKKFVSMWHGSSMKWKIKPGLHGRNLQRLVPESFKQNTTQGHARPTTAESRRSVSRHFQGAAPPLKPPPPPLPKRCPPVAPLRAERRAISIDSSLVTYDLVSDRRRMFGIILFSDSLLGVAPAFPRKARRYLPAPPPPPGTTPSGLMYSQTPVSVPPVPTPEIRKSTRPSVSCQIGRAVSK